MLKTFAVKRIALALAAGAAALTLTAGHGAQAQSPVTLHFTWYNDGQEGTVMRGLLDQFEAKNPDIKVTLDVVAFKDLHTTLGAQVSAGQGRISPAKTAPQLYDGKLLDLTPYLADPTAFKAAFQPADLTVLAGAQGGLTGYALDRTSSGLFVNTSLFNQAKVAIPTGKVTWEQWVTAAKQVRDATNVPYAVAIDRSGHRWFSMVLSYGGHLLDANGKFTIDTPGFRQAAAQLLSWNTDGLMPLEVWAGGGTGYAAATDYFVNQQLPLYYSGSWQVSQFSKVIGDKFQWQAVPAPCETVCASMPGGTFVIAFKSSQYPKQLGKLIDYLSSADAASQYAIGAQALPARIDLAKQGLAYKSNSDALNVFLQNVAEMPNEAVALQNNALINQVNFESRDRLSQVITGELTLDQAIQKIQEKMDGLQSSASATQAATSAATGAATTIATMAATVAH